MAKNLSTDFFFKESLHLEGNTRQMAKSTLNYFNTIQKLSTPIQLISPKKDRFGCKPHYANELFVLD